MTLTFPFKCVMLRISDDRAGKRTWIAEFEQQFEEEPGRALPPRLTVEHHEPLLFDLGEAYWLQMDDGQ